MWKGERGSRTFLLTCSTNGEGDIMDSLKIEMFLRTEIIFFSLSSCRTSKSQTSITLELEMLERGKERLIIHRTLSMFIVIFVVVIQCVWSKSSLNQLEGTSSSSSSSPLLLLLTHPIFLCHYFYPLPSIDFIVKDCYSYKISILWSMSFSSLCDHRSNFLLATPFIFSNLPYKMFFSFNFQRVPLNDIFFISFYHPTNFVTKNTFHTIDKFPPSTFLMGK